MFGWGKKKRKRISGEGGDRSWFQRYRTLRSRYDAAATTDDNSRYWANADALSANAAQTPAVRKVLRNRARYEVANNSYARGIVDTLANDTIGTGPRLQMLTDIPELNRTIEQLFVQWSTAIHLAEKLRTMRVAKARDGEAFAVLFDNPTVDSSVKLDVMLVEADRVTTPSLFVPTESSIDGIRYDEYGNPVEYDVLKNHPGGTFPSPTWAFDTIPAASMTHWYTMNRPGQSRGVPDIMAALPLFSQLRRYTLATLAAAETAAYYAGVLTTDSPPDAEADPIDAMDTIELETRMLTTMPMGWKLGQVKAEQPTTTYKEFKGEILNEIARCLNMPFNIAAGNSSGYNYASGRLDHQTYFKSVRVQQSHLEASVLNKLLTAWLQEALLTMNIPFSARAITEFPHQWFWDGFEHVDPIKEAKAQATRLANNTTTLAIEWARVGMDWEEKLRQRGKEVALTRELGLELPAENEEITVEVDDDK